MSDTASASPVLKKTKITRAKKTPKPASKPMPEGVTEVQPKASKASQKPPVKGLDEHGFRVGSDSSRIVAIMLAGGIDRQDINEKVAATIDPLTRNGRRKNIPSLISGLLGRLEDRGYHEEAEWKLIPPKKKR